MKWVDKILRLVVSWEKLFNIFSENYPANIYLFKVNNRNTRKLTIKKRPWRRSGVFTVNFEHISHLFIVFLLLLWTSKR